MGKKIVTIGGGNGQSNLLDALYKYGPTDIHISSIVSMSDDGRTTGELMGLFKRELGLHLPPPGDLRRCLFMMSDSEKRDEFQQYLETTIRRDIKISELTLWDYFYFVGAKEDFREYFASKCRECLDFRLPLSSSVSGHKVGNILMANLFYNLDENYHKMLDMMHHILDVRAHIIPVTVEQAYIRAILGNGQIIETQDRISNVAAYTSGIADLELMKNSKDAETHREAEEAIIEANYIVITPGDLFTSTISNFVISGVRTAIKKSKAQVIYISNTTNKGGETQGLTSLDFVNKIERYLGRSIDIFIANNKKLDLTFEEKQRFKNDISVKGGDFLYVSPGEKREFEKRSIHLIEADLLDRKTFYKHNKESLAKELLQLID